jgi:N4-gp56 family major capsid protein
MSQPVTSANLPPQIRIQAVDQLLVRPMPFCIHAELADTVKLKPNLGDIARFSRYQNLATFPAPLGPLFANPPLQPLTRVDIDAQVQYYATSVLITKQVTLINEDPVLAETTSLLAQALQETEDQLVREMMQATASVIYCVGGFNGDSPTELTQSDISGVVATLRTNSARFVTEYIEGDLKFGTGPVRDCFFALANTQLQPQVEQIKSFQAKANYPTPEKTLIAEWGTTDNVRWLLSPLGVVSLGASANGRDVFSSFIVANHSYAIVDIDEFNAEFIYVPPVPSAADPVGLRQIASSRFSFATRITNDLWLDNLISTLSL